MKLSLRYRLAAMVMVILLLAATIVGSAAVTGGRFEVYADISAVSASRVSGSRIISRPTSSI
jgi:hypothetical protein